MKENPEKKTPSLPVDQVSFLAYALKSINECVSITDLDERLIYVNESFVKTYGYTEEEIMGENIAIIRSTKNCPKVIREILPATMRTGWRGELINRKKDGTEFPVSLATSIIHDDQGNVVAVMGIATDITERRRVEEALRESERYARALLDAIPEMMFRLDRDGTYLDFKAKKEDLYFQDATILGKRNRDITPLYFAEMVEEKIRQTLESTTMQVFEYELPISNRGVRIFEARMVASGHDEVTTIARDITHEKEMLRQLGESERLLREAQIISGLGSYFLDLRTGRWKSSGVLDQIFGIDDTYDRSVDGWLSIVHPDQREKMRSYFTDEVIGRRSIFNKEYRITRFNDKAERWVHGHGRLEFDDQANLVCMHGTIQDITEQKQIQEEIKKLNNELEIRVLERTAQLETANKELEAFSYSVSHDLRAPLRAIHGFTEILMEDYRSLLDEEGQRVCSVIKDNAVQMGKLVDDLLKFSRLSRTDIHTSEIDMNALCRNVYKDLTTHERREEIDFSMDSLHNAWGDPNLIRQVWVNLISNAVKFTSYVDNVRINISSRIDQDAIIYSISDNGAGFNMKYADKLFGVFQRLHSVKEFEGTGVGLAIVQRIVHRHGGKVWAESKINHGTTFYFTLPIK
jgi:PAS domain S-box-containing protein